VNYVIQAYQVARREGYEDELQVLAAVLDSGAGVRRINFDVQAAINPNAREHNPHVNMGKPGKVDNRKYQGFIGDKVIYTKNDRELGLVNGDTGQIVDIKLGKSADQHLVYVRFDGFEDSEEHADGVFELKGEQYVPLELAYALTVHKSQGSEWPRVVVIADQAHTFLKRQLFYTAITRTSKYLTIIGTRSAVQRAVESEPDTQRATRLIERLLGLM
jgi:exodeoxyribonuclease V alpha subunit